MPKENPDISSKYLRNLKFDPKLKIGLVASWITNIRLVILLLLGILLLGIFSYTNIPRRLNPEIKIPIVMVTTVLPGASPEDIESLISIPLETDLQGINGIDTLSSVSTDNVSLISMQFLSSVPVDKAKQDVQSIVDAFSDLPKDAQAPKVKALDFEDQPIWTFAVQSKTHDIPSLMRFSDTLKKALENTPKVDRVLLSGFENQEIVVVFKPEKIRQYAINPLTISSLIKTNYASYPAGSVQTANNTFALTIDSQIAKVEDLRKLRLQINGTSVNLGDIATITERSQDNQNQSFIADKKSTQSRVVTFNVYKTTNANFDVTEKAIRSTIDTVMSQYQNRFTITTITNYAAEISKQFSDLLSEFRSTILLVMACLFIFLGLRQALISSVTVPLTYLSAFIFMRIFGMSINFLSLFAFLIALGLLVDDTIVTVSAMTTYFKTRKFSSTETGLIVWRDTIVPIWSTTITTIWSFVPLLLSTGIIGEFIKPIPIVVTVTMISSTAIAVLITLPFMIVILKPQFPKRVAILLKIFLTILFSGFVLYFVRTNPLFGLITLVYISLGFVFFLTRKHLTQKVQQYIQSNSLLSKISERLLKYTNHGVVSIDPLSRKYYALISRILSSKSARKKVIIGIVVYAIWAFALLPLGFVKNEFFPKTNEDRVYVTMELPSGTNLITTMTKSQAVLESLRKIPEAQFVIADTGTSVSRMSGATSSTDNTSLFTIHLTPKEKRVRSSIEIADTIRNMFQNYTPAKVSVIEESAGPPAGAELQIKLLGDDLGQLDQYADKIQKFLSTQSGVTNVDKSIKPGTSKIVFIPDTQKLVDAGLTTDALGLWMRTFASGFTLGDVNFDKSAKGKQNIVFTFDGGVESPEAITTINIPTQNGAIPLVTLGTFEVRSNPTSITRENGKRTISVSAGVRGGISATEKNKDLVKFADSLKLPPGYSWKTGGINEENAKSVQSILQAMALAFILILVTMVIQFKSYRQALIVLLVIPLAVSSVFVAFALTGTPLSFPALIGVLSLFGIVVTNSMFIVDKINLNLKEGMNFHEAIADSGASRLEPIILTKLCTVFGLLPITLSNALWRGLGGAIISGLLIASTIMLLFIPVVYYEWFKGEAKTK